MPKLKAPIKNKTLSKVKTQNRVQKEQQRLHQKLASKKILEVYTQNDKLFISNSSAYSLNLINVRAIMSTSPQFIEITPEILANLNQKDFVFEYIQLNEDEIFQKNDNLLLTLQNLQNNYGVAVHNIITGNLNNKLEIATNITSEGLRLNPAFKTILGSTISVGINFDAQNTMEDIINYNLGNSPTPCKIIVASPLILNNGNSQLCLGFPEKNLKTAGQQYNEHCILDAICNNLHCIPKEFILGYYYTNENNQSYFIKNNSHFSTMNTDEQNLFIDNLTNIIKGTYFENINHYINTSNIDALNEMGNKLFELGLDTTLIQNSIDLIYKTQQIFDTKSNLREISLNETIVNEYTPKTHIRKLVGFEQTTQNNFENSESMER